jgi:hypothetical protein
MEGVGKTLGLSRQSVDSHKFRLMKALWCKPGVRQSRRSDLSTEFGSSS